MLLKKTHNPKKNAELLSQVTGRRLDIKRAVRETELLLEQCREKTKPPQHKPTVATTLPLKERVSEGLFRLVAQGSEVLKPTKVSVSASGHVAPDWKTQLDQEFHLLAAEITKKVNVVDFGAVGDGKTDCTKAFQKAIGNGRVKVIVPKGVYVVNGIRLPSWTSVVGAGKGVTTIKLQEQAPKGTRLVTNKNHWRGNHHILVQGLSLDWNVERLGQAPRTSTWGNHSSCLTYANVTYGWVKDVEAINPGLHGFDISSTIYNYAGDGFRARGSSKYVWLDNLNAYGFGDDGITTHHSDYILISNCHMCDPSGRAHQRGFSNSNGIEVDDGSRNVVLVNNSTSRCFGGVEIKAHQNSSAASNVIIVGHISVNDNRSYNFRHIGHHKSTDAESKSAYNIMAVNLVSITPVFTELYKGSTPRSLVVSAYKNVVINHFTSIGDPNYDYKGNPVGAIQYRAQKVVLQNVTIKDFKTAGSGIKVYGGENRGESIHIRNVLFQNCAGKPIEIAKKVQDASVKNIKEIKLKP